MSANPFADAINLLSAQIIECRQTVFALASALGNQPALDRPRLAQDFLTSLRLANASLDPPSAEIAALLTALQAKTELSPQLTIAERLIRSGVLQPPQEE